MTEPAFTPAFPHDNTSQNYSGMDLRDYFAAKAMAALITEPMWNEHQTALALEIGKNGTGGAPLYASAAYAMADAMLESRKK